MASEDFVVSVRQIAQNPQVTSASALDRLLLQQTGIGGPYRSISPVDLISSALDQGGWLRLAPGSGIAWNGSALGFNPALQAFEFTAPVIVPSLSSVGDVMAGGLPLATRAWVQGLYDTARAGTVFSFNGRRGAVLLEDRDILRAGGVLQRNPTFAGQVSVPTLWNPLQNDDSAASTAWVQQMLCHWLTTVPFFNGRPGPTWLTTADVNQAYFNSPLGVHPRAPTPSPSDASTRIATTEWVSEATFNLKSTIYIQMDENTQQVLDYLNLHYAPLASPVFTGHPNAPTPPQTSNDGSLATTAYVRQAVQASTSGVSSWMGRTGDVLMTVADIVAAGGAPLSSPALGGVPTAPTAAVGTNTNQLATCAFVLEQVGALTAGVSSFNGRGGAVSLQLSDITGIGGAPINAPAFTGSATAITQPPGTSNTSLATTQFVAQALAQSAAGVSSFMSRTGAVSLLSTDISAVGGALAASPTFTGVPQSVTPSAGSVGTMIATKAYVDSNVGVTSFNTRAGAVTLQLSDITGAGGAPAASPALTGTPTAPTAPAGTANTQLATTAFVSAALGGGGVASLNGHTGALSVSVNQRLFTANATYVPTPGTVLAMVECVGGSGGGGATAYGPSWGMVAGGGGSGGYSRSILTAAQLGASQAITVGQGGAGAVGAATTPPAGGNGTATSFGSLVIALGGLGGLSFDAGNNWGGGGPGAAAGTGQLALAGNPGSVGGGSYRNATLNAVSNIGNGGDGGSMFSGAGLGGNTMLTATPGATGSNGSLGGGGGGAAAFGAGGPWNGGNGGGGWCLVTELVIG